MPRVRINNGDRSTNAAQKMHEVLRQVAFPTPLRISHSVATFGDVIFSPITSTGLYADIVLSGIRIRIRDLISGRSRRVMVGRTDSSMDPAQLLIRAQQLQTRYNEQEREYALVVEARREAQQVERDAMTRIIDGVVLPENVMFRRAFQRSSFIIEVRALLPEQATALLKSVDEILKNPEWDDGI